MSTSEILRAIHVGLLCVQQRPEDRPGMSSVILMLNNEGMLPQAKQPGFFTEDNGAYCSNSSTTRITITTLDPR